VAILTRDPEKTAEQLAEWLTQRFADRGGATVGEVGVPPGSGFSGETLLFDATWGDGATDRLVVRVAPTVHTVFWDPDFEGQYRVMAALSEHTDVPMPEMLAYEGDERWLGAPFSLMRRVDGEAPADRPSYTEAGFVFDASPDERRRLYDSGLEAMARVHRSDWRALGLDFLSKPELGEPGVDQMLADVERWWAAISDGTPNPVIEATFAWLREHRPPSTPPEHVALCWGDARIGNQLFHDFDCVAVLDWEMVALGDPLSDLGWWKFVDRHHHEMRGLDRLTGFASYDETVARWAERVGRTVDPDLLAFYEIFGGLRFAIVMVRLASLLVEIELIPDAGDMATNNVITHLLARILDLPEPGPLVVY